MQKPRSPAVAGSFYPSSGSALRETIKDCFLDRYGPGKLPCPPPNREGRRIAGLITPHAGYIYSGPVAAHAYYQLSREKTPETIVVIGPNHTGLGPAVSVSADGEWITPLGQARVDKALAHKIVTSSDILSADDGAHMLEHSVEVQLPFLQFLFGEDFQFVPICMLDQTLEISLELGEAISASSEDALPLIIASTDFTHYESSNMARRKDQKAIEAILQLDVDAFLETVEQMQISMCGSGPVAAMLVASGNLGAKKAELLAYQTSGDVTGDYNAVVGYAAVEVSI